MFSRDGTNTDNTDNEKCNDDDGTNEIQKKKKLTYSARSFIAFLFKHLPHQVQAITATTANTIPPAIPPAIAAIGGDDEFIGTGEMEAVCAGPVNIVVVTNTGPWSSIDVEGNGEEEKMEFRDESVERDPDVESLGETFWDTFTDIWAFDVKWRCSRLWGPGGNKRSNLFSCMSSEEWVKQEKKEKEKKKASNDDDGLLKRQLETLELERTKTDPGTQGKKYQEPEGSPG